MPSEISNYQMIPHTQTYTHTHTHTHTHKHIHKHIATTQIQTYTRKNTRKYHLSFIHKYIVYILRRHVHIYEDLYVCMYIYTHAYILHTTCVHIYKHLLTHNRHPYIYQNLKRTSEALLLPAHCRILRKLSSRSCLWLLSCCRIYTDIHRHKTRAI